MAAVGFWSFALAALLFALVAGWQAGRRERVGLALTVACAATAVWAAASAAEPATLGALLAESARNLGWLAFLYLLLRRGGPRARSLDALYLALGFAQLVVVAIDLLHALEPASSLPIEAAAVTTRMVFAVGALVAAHNLYQATAPGARAGVRLPLTALAVLWGYDLNLYTLVWLNDARPVELDALRGLVALALAPLVALAARRNAGWSIRLSRSVTFSSLALVGALGYLLAMIALAAALQPLAGARAGSVQALVMLAAAAAVAMLTASPRWRAWIGVMFAKHLFAHRYDYRAEWLRFTDTLARADHSVPLEARVVQAIADITQSPGGLLLVPVAEGLSIGARWRTVLADAPLTAGGDELARRLATGRIVELGPLRSGPAATSAEASAIPQWIIADLAAWAIVPLIHVDRLAGAVLLERPVVGGAQGRALDWEDFDVLRLAGRQVAAALAEARSQAALSEAQRFDEFNRRFAFIVHDIKNLVSQLNLMSRNAERHADNPAFRVDLIATLNGSTARMTSLLERLSPQATRHVAPPAAIAIGPIAAAIAAARRVQHPIVVAGDQALFGVGDAAGLEQALGQLVQNAIEASPPAEPVTITLTDRGAEVAIEVSDRGPGMTAEFVRTALFKPFASTKPAGFGIGAHEAQTLISAMGGRIAVVSGAEGTRMTVVLATRVASEAEPERMVA